MKRGRSGRTIVLAQLERCASTIFLSRTEISISFFLYLYAETSAFPTVYRICEISLFVGTGFEKRRMLPFSN